MNQRRSNRAVVDGWVVLDKPVGMTSTQAVTRLKRIYNGKKAGHAGTLDPLASGILPVAFGEATKTVPFVQDGEKTYLFTVRWGAETDTDNSDGKIVRESDARPEASAIAALLPRFVGDILQTPPQYSAIKIAGERAYDLAREGEHVELQPRPVTIHRLEILESAGDETKLVMDCGKGAYVRAIARDVGRLLGCFGHVTALRRTRVGPFVEQDSFTFEEIEAEGGAAEALQSVEAGLTELPCVVVDRNSAARLRRGGSLILRGRDAPAGGVIYASCGGVPVAFRRSRRGRAVALAGVQSAVLAKKSGGRFLGRRRNFASRIQRYVRYCPPLTVSVEPVMKPASSAARNTTARAISSGSPRRPTAMCGMICLSSTSCGTAFTISVAI